LAATQTQSQEMIEKFMWIRKSKHKETRQEMQQKADISYECLVVSEELKKNKLTEIIGLLCLEHLNIQERKSVITLIH